MKSMIGLLVVALIAGLIYKFYFTRMQSSGVGASTPAQTIDVVGVKNDLIGIAQAERAYQAEHGSYASLDDLISSGGLTMKKTARDGYTYDVETSPATFRAVAHCPVATSPGCQNYSVDQTMEVEVTP
ncbi:MAG TPA: hypothetical protein VJW93_03310 [Candidatus Acidoferrales bacterium]|nr:hypothetical protein [Candidatus Acidoferrales bacterium]